MTRLMANGGGLLNSVMGRVSKEPDIIFLQVGGNDFPRTARNQRDADAFSLQLLELASPLNDRYKAKRVLWVAFCRAFQLTDPGDAFFR